MNSEWFIVRSQTSPDGCFRVEELEDAEYNERGAPYRRWRVVFGDEVFDLPFNPGGEVEFDDAGNFSMDVYYYASNTVRVVINPRQRTFASPSTGEEPLAILPAHIEKLYSLASLAAGDVPVRNIVGNLILALLSLGFVLAGIFILLYINDEPRDTWVGLACIVFFGACAVSNLFDVRRQFRKRREALTAREALARLAGRPAAG